MGNYFSLWPNWYWSCGEPLINSCYSERWSNRKEIMCFGPEYIFLFIMLNILIAVITQDFWGKITRYQLFRKYTLYYKDHRCVNFHLPIKYYFQNNSEKNFCLFLCTIWLRQFYSSHQYILLFIKHLLQFFFKEANKVHMNIWNSIVRMMERKKNWIKKCIKMLFLFFFSFFLQNTGAIKDLCGWILESYKTFLYEIYINRQNAKRRSMNCVTSYCTINCIQRLLLPMMTPKLVKYDITLFLQH